MSRQTSPNVLLIVLDAARADSLHNSDSFQDLAESNLQFTKAVAPSTWSLPSHPSLFSGKLPSEHGCYRVTNQRMDSLPLVDYLSDQDYATAAVSANGFASPRTGFHRPFDEFHYTSDWSPFEKGINITETAFRIRSEQPDITTKELTKSVLSCVVRHKFRIRSLVNFGTVTLNRLSGRLSPLQRIPHPLFNSYSQYSYTPEKNTTWITTFLSEADRPFFLFANYMDTHRPYNPPEEFCEEHLSDPLRYPEIAQLNEVAAPWEYIRRVETGQDVDSDTERIRGLYAGEVDSAVEHLERLIEALKLNDLYEETFIIITSDHGENLGEIDLLGNRRMGHEASISRELLYVPLVIMNPDLEPYTVDTHVSIRPIFNFLTEGLIPRPKSSAEISDYFEQEGPVVAEYPATGGERLFEKYPEVPRSAIRLRTAVHFSVAFENDWISIADSMGNRSAWNGDVEQEYEAAPRSVRRASEEHLEKLQNQSEDGGELSDAEVSQLKALGYL